MLPGSVVSMAPGAMEYIMMTEKKVAAVGFCCVDIYENINEWYATAPDGGSGQCGERGRKGLLWR